MSGGKQTPRDVMNYSAPKGPNNINDAQSPGIHGDNYGCCGTQGASSIGAQTSGSPGLGGDGRKPSGTQGKR